MKHDVATRDEKLTAECAQLLANNEAALRAELLRRIVLPHLARLRGNNPAKWNEAGWYTALDEAGHTESSSACNSTPPGFPVPYESTNWYPCEYEALTPFRFFHTEAFLDLPVPQAPCRVAFDILHVILPEALARLSLHASGIPLQLGMDGNRDLPANVEAQLDESVLARARTEGRLRLTFRSGVSGVPALLYPASRDRRRLSIAITYPQLKT